MFIDCQFNLPFLWFLQRTSVRSRDSKYFHIYRLHNSIDRMMISCHLGLHETTSVANCRKLRQMLTIEQKQYHMRVWCL